MKWRNLLRINFDGRRTLHQSTEGHWRRANKRGPDIWRDYSPNFLFPFHSLTNSLMESINKTGLCHLNGVKGQRLWEAFFLITVFLRETRFGSRFKNWIVTNAKWFDFDPFFIHSEMVRKWNCNLWATFLYLCNIKAVKKFPKPREGNEMNEFALSLH